MKSIKLFLLFVFALSLTLSSCKKDEAIPAKNKLQMLTAKTWKFTSSKTAGIEGILDCDKDNTISFTVGIWTANPGAIKCDPSETIDTGTWSLSADQNNITIDSDTYPIVVTETQFVVTIGTEVLTYTAL